MLRTQVSSPYETDLSPLSSPSSVHTAVAGQASSVTPGPITGLAAGYSPTTWTHRNSQGTNNHHTQGFSSANSSFSSPQSPGHIANSFASSISQGGSSGYSRHQHNHPPTDYPDPGQWNPDIYDLSGGAHTRLADHSQQYHNNDEPPPSYQSLGPAMARPAQQYPISEQGIYDMALRMNPADQGSLSQQPHVTGTLPVTETVCQLVREVKQGVTPDPVSCDECPQKFKGIYRNGNLKRHKRSQHPRPGDSSAEITCDQCFKPYRRRDALKKHLRKIHGLGGKKKRRGPRTLSDSMGNLLGNACS
jgi:hypothetical protein